MNGLYSPQVTSLQAPLAATISTQAFGPNKKKRKLQKLLVHSCIVNFLLAQNLSYCKFKTTLTDQQHSRHLFM